MSGKTIGDLIREQMDVRNADDDAVLAYKIQEAQEEIYGIEVMNSADLLQELRSRGIVVELERPPVLEVEEDDRDINWDNVTAAKTQVFGSDKNKG